MIFYKLRREVRSNCSICDKKIFNDGTIATSLCRRISSENDKNRTGGCICVTRDMLCRIVMPHKKFCASVPRPCVKVPGRSAQSEFQFEPSPMDGELNQTASFCPADDPLNHRLPDALAPAVCEQCIEFRPLQGDAFRHRIMVAELRLLAQPREQVGVP